MRSPYQIPIVTDRNLVVTVQWLQAHLHDPQVAIADCRFSLLEPDSGQQQYLSGHIPGAYYLDLNRDLSSTVGQHGGRHPLPDATALSTKLAAMGIHSDPPTLVVAYDDSRFAFASRLWWLLSYLGHDRVAVLDGGFATWQQAGYAIATDVPPARMGMFSPRVRSELVVGIDEVKARKDLPDVVLVDSREGDRYRGEREPIDPVAGHIPGAANYPWQTVSDSQGFLLPQQGDRWSDIDRAREILVYCGSGVTACVNLLSLKLAGIETGKLYAGSWSDWCSYEGAEIGRSTSTEK